MQLVEGAKISQQILRQAINDPNFTFGIEAEFYIEGAAQFMQDYMTSGQETITHSSKVGGIDYEDEYYAKNLRDTTWHDVLHYFKPLGVQEDYRQPPLIMQQRLETFYKENVGREKLGAPSKLWDALKEHLSVPVLMAALQIFPDGRFVGLPENQEKTFRNIVYDGDISEIKPFGKLGDIQYITDSPEDSDIRGSFHGIRGLTMTQPAFLELVADDLSTKLGTEVISVMDDTKVFHAGDYKTWVVTSDDSLFKRAKVTTGKGMAGVEVVSPIMSAEEGLAMLNKMLDIMNGTILGLNVFTTAETGLHINLGVKNKQIDPIKILVLSGDEHIVNKFDRANSEYASSVQSSMRDRMASVAGGEAPAGMDASKIGTRKDVNSLIAQAQEVLKGIETDERDIDRVVSVLNNIKPTGKSQSIDFDKLASGYVEYRAIGNKDYEKRKGEIMDSVLHMIGMTHIATEPSAYRKEFLKKLYLMVQRTVATADEPITASVGMIGYGPRGGYGSPIENEPKTPYDGEEFLTKYGFDPGSDTQ